ncbi:MAG: AAA family ATPase [Phycisphaerae bacterium]|nr:AAA family ATPase [Saprospiraceae bacterium]
MTHGFIIGKFSPFHLGHVFLIQQALAKCEELTVFVTSHESDAIPGWQRYHWVKSTFPELDVRHIIDSDSSQLPESLELSGSSLQKIEIILGNLPTRTTLLFESGEKLKSLAQHLGFQHIAIEVERRNFPIPTCEIRKNPLAHWDLLPRNVRPYYIQRIALVGPESCGKSYLAEKLALHFNTVFVEEYGRAYCEKFGMDSTELDFAHVAGGQLYHEDEMALQANRLLFCDTDLIVTQVWSEVYFKGKCQPWIFWADHARRYDLFLLCTPDIPWVNDGLREYEGQREWMFERLRRELESRGLKYEIIQGGFEERTASAIQAVERIAGLNSTIAQL